MWAVWNCACDVLLTPGHSALSPPNLTHVNWTILIYFQLNGSEDLLKVYQNSLKFVRPGDFIVFVVRAKRRVSIGDNRETRFEFGKRLDWATEKSMLSQPYYSEDSDLEILINDIRNLLILSKIEGVVRVEHDLPATTTAQLLCRACIEERADLMIIKQNADLKSTIIECAQESPCSIAIMK